MSKIKIEKVNNGYIVIFNAVITHGLTEVTEVYKQFEDMIKEIEKYFGEG